VSERVQYTVAMVHPITIKHQGALEVPLALTNALLSQLHICIERRFNNLRALLGMEVH
jgi:hypothetical protein